MPARSLLYVDRDQGARATLARELARRGHEVLCAADRAGALALFRHQPFDAVVVDLGSDREGVALLLEIKELARDAFLPAVLLTSSTDQAARIDALRAGVDDVCSKPVHVDELDARLGALHRVRAREQRLRADTGRFRTFAFTDPLTGLGNRRAFDAELGRAWARSCRSGRPLGLFLVDIDHFKQFNDRHGHRTGDAVLAAVARTLGREVRTGDQAFRFGGEEFALLVADADPAGLASLGERLRAAIAARSVVAPAGASWRGRLAVTASIGGALAPEVGVATKEALVEAADRALYQAKEEGRNRVGLALPTRAPEVRTHLPL
jgi:two-component system, cell cycle response regulator